MKKYYHILVVVILISGDTFAIGNKDKKVLSEKEKIQLTQNRKGSGLCFTPNKGQIADMNGNLCPDVLYKGDGGGADIYFRKTGISYVYSNMNEVMHKVNEQVEDLIKAEIILESDEQKKTDELMQKEKIKTHRVDMDFEGANKNCRFINDNELEGYTNYYHAHCPNGVLNVKQYNKVTCKNIYNGIDITYYGNSEKGLKYDLIVQPHADPRQIKIHWTGAEKIEIKNGELKIKNFLGEMIETLPKVYQNINGKIIDVKAEYSLESIISSQKLNDKTKDSGLKTLDYIVTFKLSNYQTEYPLIIDPYWATYYGGNQRDISAGIATDFSGNVLITGTTWGGSFPIGNAGITNITWQSAFGGTVDAFVVKFDTNGNRLWATYYGGDQAEFSSGIVTDLTSNVIVTGYTSSNTFPIGNAGITNITWQGAYGGAIDAFVVKFDANGSRLWATYYGGDKDDRGAGVATDQSGNVVITGYTMGGTFPIGNIGGANVSWQTPFGGGGLFSFDAFIVKFDANGNRIWATYYGGDKDDRSNGVAIDQSSNVVVTGYTAGGTFPIGNAGGANVSWQTPFGGGGVDAFVVKFDANGGRLWATYYGGNKGDIASGIATDLSGNVVITGYTGGGTFPIGNSGMPNVTWQSIFGGGFGGTDAYVCKFDANGSRLWATYYGGNQSDYGYKLATDMSSNIYLLMEVEDVASPSLVDACAWQPLFNGGSATNIPGNHVEVEDQTIVKFNPNGKKICATYLGGTGEDDLDQGLGGIAIYRNLLYVTGETDGGFPVTAGATQTVFGGPSGVWAWDAYVASLCINICEGNVLALDFTANTLAACTNAPIAFTPSVSNSCDTTGYKFHWVFSGGSPASSDLVNPTVTFSGVGTHDVKLVVTTLCKKDSLTKNNYINITQCAVCNLIGQFTKGTAACTACGCKQWIMINATGGTSPYTYTWPDGYVNRYKNQLCPGVYTINIRDKNGCSINVNLNTP